MVLDDTSYRSSWPWKAAGILCLALLNAIWIAATDFRFDYPSLTSLVGMTALLAVVGTFYRTKRPNARFEILCAETAFLLTFSANAAVTSYLVTSLNLPLIDDHLIAFDRMVGFDWEAYVGFVNARPAIGTVSSLLYITTLSQVALAVLVLGLTGPLKSAGRFVSAVALSAIACIVVSGLLPAGGALATIAPGPEFFGANAPVVDLAYKQTFFDLRSGAERLISLDQPRGLIAFPSYHCTLSVLLILACWPLRILRWPVFVINVLIILTTPIDGGHHLADAFGGIAVALLAWKATSGRIRLGRTQPVPAT
ncbi:MAG: phosphatase PAP2 family protein [Rhizobiaceae bacterium]|nr:phosphatase PAP2 family protein [Rhizobiaceae bacterium]